MKISFIISFILILSSCSNKDSDSVGYIDLDNAINPKPFSLCKDKVIQYYNGTPYAKYKTGKKQLRKFIIDHYRTESSESGYFTVRFIINCKGEPGAYEIVENDLHYMPKKFDKKVSDALLSIIQNLHNWNPAFIKNTPRNSFMYLTIKLEDGKILEILP